jgi:hypothetical protein
MRVQVAKQQYSPAHKKQLQLSATKSCLQIVSGLQAPHLSRIVSVLFADADVCHSVCSRNTDMQANSIMQLLSVCCATGPAKILFNAQCQVGT